MRGKHKGAIGRDYEQRAAEYLRAQGYAILGQNYQAGHKEIDLIARIGDVIVFVEVKAARTDSFGHPAEWVTDSKRRRLTEAARHYLYNHDTSDCDLRFDVIVFLEGRLEHYPDAFSVTD